MAGCGCAFDYAQPFFALRARRHPAAAGRLRSLSLGIEARRQLRPRSLDPVPSRALGVRAGAGRYGFDLD